MPHGDSRQLPLPSFVIMIDYRKGSEEGNMAKHSRNISSKWSKHEALRRSSRLARYMPETRRMSFHHLDSMLKKYGMVYVKPVFGSLGIGVMRVDRVDRGLRYQKGLVRKTFRTVAAGYFSLLRETGGKPYMVQRGIPLARHGGRPYDIRVMVQRRPGRPWKVTGMAGRVAYPGKIVTNGSQGGTIFPVSGLLDGGMRSRIRKIGLRAAYRLHAVYPGLVEMGLDVAVDRNRRPWILEANTHPDPCPFTKLPSLGALRKILRYQRAWGIRRKLRCLKARSGVASSVKKKRTGRKRIRMRIAYRRRLTRVRRRRLW